MFHHGQAERQRGKESMAGRKSLFVNILRVSPSGSRFYGDQALPSIPQTLKNQYFSQRWRKNSSVAMPPSSMFPIFCPQNIEPVGFIFNFPLTH
jgi:hypothetical protein